MSDDAHPHARRPTTPIDERVLLEMDSLIGSGEQGKRTIAQTHARHGQIQGRFRQPQAGIGTMEEWPLAMTDG